MMTMPPEGKIRMNLNIDEKLHYQFKLACAMGGERMTDVVMELIQSYVKDHPVPAPRKAKK
jgi:hypothetical protein